MNLNPRFSQLATAMLCAVAFLFTAAIAPAKPTKNEKVVGTVTKIENGTTVLVNKKPVSSGSEVRCGDLIETDPNESVWITLGSKQYVIDPSSRVRLVCDGNRPVELLVIFGGVHPADSDTGFDVGPFLGAFGFGNFAGTSIGGGGGGSSIGGTTTRVLADGQIGLFDSFGRFVQFRISNSF